MKYIYQARSKEGKLETGTVEASSKEAAALLLQKYNIFVVSVKEQTPFIFRPESISFLNKVSKRELAVFSREMAVMLRARVPVTQSLNGLAIQIKTPIFKERILKVAQLVEEGNPLSEALGSFPETFDIFYISLIKTGEASGKISDSLAFLSDHLEREADIKSEITSAMVYPVFVIGFMLIMVPIVILFVMPKLVELLKQSTTKPPPTTEMMINFYSFLASYGWIFIGLLLILIIFIIYYLTTKNGKKVWDQWSLKIPFFGGFLRKTFLVRFAENISTLISSGISINNALSITKETVGNDVYKKIIAETEARVSEGEKISSVLVKYPNYVPPFVVQMVQVGEDTGTLDKNLLQIVNFYNKEIQRAIKTFTAMLEPVMIVFLGIGVALLAFSVIQPIYGILQTI